MKKISKKNFPLKKRSSFAGENKVEPEGGTQASGRTASPRLSGYKQQAEPSGGKGHEKAANNLG